MDIFEQQEMSKSRPQVKGKLKKWCDWLVNHVPKPFKDFASRAFNHISTGLFCLVVALGGGGGCFPPPFHNSFVFKVRLLKFCTEILSDRMNNLR